MFLRKSITTELIPHIRLHFLSIVTNKINFLFFSTSIFLVLLKQQNLFFFPCITLQFVLWVSVKIYPNGILFHLLTSFFVVFWKTIQIVFFLQLHDLHFFGFEKTRKDYIFRRITRHFNIFFLLKIFNNGVISTCYTLCFVVLWKTIQIIFFHLKDSIFVISLKQQIIYFFHVLHFN